MGNSQCTENKDKERPGPPGQPHVFVCEGSKGILVKWTPPTFDGNTPITSYVVYKCAVGSNHWERAHAAPTKATEIVIHGLTPGQPYQVRVIAENSVGASMIASPTSDAFIAPYDQFSARKPEFILNLRDVTAIEGERIEFEVEVDGIPLPEVKFYKDGLEIYDGEKASIIKGPGGVFYLIFRSLSVENSGEIKCVAFSDAGESVSVAKLQVEAPPRAVLSRQLEEGVIFEAKETLRLRVSYTGKPAPDVTWYHEGTLLQPGGRVEIETSSQSSTLKITNVKRLDRGEYVVRLSSPIGEDSQAILVTITDRPSPPGPVSVKEVTSKSVRLSWNPPEDDGGCKISSYIVEYYRRGWNIWLRGGSFRQLEGTLSDLLPGSEYKFRVKAENPYGISDPSKESPCITLPQDNTLTDTQITPEGLDFSGDETTIGSSILPLDGEETSQSENLPINKNLSVGIRTEGDLSELFSDSELAHAAPPIPSQVWSAPDFGSPDDSFAPSPKLRYVFSDTDFLPPFMSPMKGARPNSSSKFFLESEDLLSGIGSSSEEFTQDDISQESVSITETSNEALTCLADPPELVLPQTDPDEELSIDGDSDEEKSIKSVATTAYTQGSRYGGLLLPRSPARMFVHDHFVTSGLDASSRFVGNPSSRASEVDFSDLQEELEGESNFSQSYINPLYEAVSFQSLDSSNYNDAVKEQAIPIIPEGMSLDNLAEQFQNAYDSREAAPIAPQRRKSGGKNKEVAEIPTLCLKEEEEHVEALFPISSEYAAESVRKDQSYPLEGFILESTEPSLGCTDTQEYSENKTLPTDENTVLTSSSNMNPETNKNASPSSEKETIQTVDVLSVTQTSNLVDNSLLENIEKIQGVGSNTNDTSLNLAFQETEHLSGACANFVSGNEVSVQNNYVIISSCPEEFTQNSKKAEMSDKPLSAAQKSMDIVTNIPVNEAMSIGEDTKNITDLELEANKISIQTKIDDTSSKDGNSCQRFSSDSDEIEENSEDISILIEDEFESAYRQDMLSTAYSPELGQELPIIENILLENSSPVAKITLQSPENTFLTPSDLSPDHPDSGVCEAIHQESIIQHSEPGRRQDNSSGGYDSPYSVIISPGPIEDWEVDVVLKEEWNNAGIDKVVQPKFETEDINRLVPEPSSQNLNNSDEPVLVEPVCAQPTDEIESSEAGLFSREGTPNLPIKKMDLPSPSGSDSFKTAESATYKTAEYDESGSSKTEELKAEIEGEESIISSNPVFVRTLSCQSVKIGNRVRFLAEVSSSEIVEAKWHFNGKLIEAGERFETAEDENCFALEINPALKEDHGQYTLVAKTERGVAKSTANLEIIIPKSYKEPVFLEELRAVLTEAGTVSLEVKVVGIPTPVLKWFKDGVEIKAGDTFALAAGSTDLNSLGVYTCEASNYLGKAVSSSKVTIRGNVNLPQQKNSAPDTFPGSPPLFIDDLFDQKIKVGEFFTLSVRVATPPYPTSIEWYNKGQLRLPSDKYHYMDIGDGEYCLEISPIELEDDGEWRCDIATGGGVSSSSCNVTLSVPKNYRKPRFLEKLKAVLTDEGLVSFECRVVGFPTPQLRWYKDGKELKPGDVYQLSGTNSLGSYSCIAKNCMGEAESSAELTLKDIHNQLNEEERSQLEQLNRPPQFVVSLKSSEAKVGDPFRFSVQVTPVLNPTLTWFHEEDAIEPDDRFHFSSGDKCMHYLDISPVEVGDQGEWKCVALNDFGHSVSSCSLRLTVPRNFKKPRFLEGLKAVLSQEGTVNLECKVIGVPQPVLKWFKDGVELKPGDIHRIMSGQDGTCCLGTYTCEAHNCMGTASSSATLLGFEEKRAVLEQPVVPLVEHIKIARNPSLSTIQEEMSQFSVATLQTQTMEEKQDVSVSLDGREVSLSLYETPDLTEEEAQKVVDMFAEELCPLVVGGQYVVELPPLRFVRESSTAGRCTFDATVIDLEEAVSERMKPQVDEEDLRTDANLEELPVVDIALTQMSKIDLNASILLPKSSIILEEKRDEVQDIVLAEEKNENVARKVVAYSGRQDSLANIPELTHEVREAVIGIDTGNHLVKDGEGEDRKSLKDGVQTSKSDDVSTEKPLNKQLPTVSGALIEEVSSSEMPLDNQKTKFMVETEELIQPDSIGAIKIGILSSTEIEIAEKLNIDLEAVEVNQTSSDIYGATDKGDKIDEVLLNNQDQLEKSGDEYAKTCFHTNNDLLKCQSKTIASGLIELGEPETVLEVNESKIIVTDISNQEPPLKVASEDIKSLKRIELLVEEKETEKQTKINEVQSSLKSEEILKPESDEIQKTFTDTMPDLQSITYTVDPNQCDSQANEDVSQLNSEAVFQAADTDKRSAIEGIGHTQICDLQKNIEETSENLTINDPLEVASEIKINENKDPEISVPTLEKEREDIIKQNLFPAVGMVSSPVESIEEPGKSCGEANLSIPSGLVQLAPKAQNQHDNIDKPKINEILNSSSTLLMEHISSEIPQYTSPSQRISEDDKFEKICTDVNLTEASETCQSIERDLIEKVAIITEEPFIQVENYFSTEEINSDVDQEANKMDALKETLISQESIWSAILEKPTSSEKCAEHSEKSSNLFRLDTIEQLYIDGRAEPSKSIARDEIPLPAENTNKSGPPSTANESETVHMSDEELGQINSTKNVPTDIFMTTEILNIIDPTTLEIDLNSEAGEKLPGNPKSVKSTFQEALELKIPLQIMEETPKEQGEKLKIVPSLFEILGESLSGTGNTSSKNIDKSTDEIVKENTLKDQNITKEVQILQSTNEFESCINLVPDEGFSLISSQENIPASTNQQELLPLEIALQTDKHSNTLDKNPGSISTTQQDVIVPTEITVSEIKLGTLSHEEEAAIIKSPEPLNITFVQEEKELYKGGPIISALETQEMVQPLGKEMQIESTELKIKADDFQGLKTSLKLDKEALEEDLLIKEKQLENKNKIMDHLPDLVQKAKPDLHSPRVSLDCDNPEKLNKMSLCEDLPAKDEPSIDFSKSKYNENVLEEQNVVLLLHLSHEIPSVISENGSYFQVAADPSSTEENVVEDASQASFTSSNQAKAIEKNKEPIEQSLVEGDMTIGANVESSLRLLDIDKSQKPTKDQSFTGGIINPNLHIMIDDGTAEEGQLAQELLIFGNFDKDVKATFPCELNPNDTVCDIKEETLCSSGSESSSATAMIASRDIENLIAGIEIPGLQIIPTQSKIEDTLMVESVGENKKYIESPNNSSKLQFEPVLEESFPDIKDINGSKKEKTEPDLKNILISPVSNVSIEFENSEFDEPFHTAKDQLSGDDGSTTEGEFSEMHSLADISLISDMVKVSKISERSDALNIESPINEDESKLGSDGNSIRSEDIMKSADPREIEKIEEINPNLALTPPILSFEKLCPREDRLDVNIDTAYLENNDQTKKANAMDFPSFEKSNFEGDLFQSTKTEKIEFSEQRNKSDAIEPIQEISVPEQKELEIKKKDNNSILVSQLVSSENTVIKHCDFSKSFEAGPDSDSVEKVGHSVEIQKKKFSPQENKIEIAEPLQEVFVKETFVEKSNVTKSTDPSALSPYYQESSPSTSGGEIHNIPLLKIVSDKVDKLDAHTIKDEVYLFEKQSEELQASPIVDQSYEQREKITRPFQMEDNLLDLRHRPERTFTTEINMSSDSLAMRIQNQEAENTKTIQEYVPSLSPLLSENERREILIRAKAQSRSKIISLEAELQTAKSELRKAKNEVDAAKNELYGAQKEIRLNEEDSVSETEALSCKVENTRKKMKQMEKEKATLKSNAIANRHAIQSLKDSKRNLCTQKERLERDKESFHKQVKELENNKSRTVFDETTKRELSELNEKLSILQETMPDLQKEVNVAQSEYETVKDNIQNCKSILKSATELEMNEAQEKDCLTRNIESLTRKRERLGKDIERNKDSLETYVSISNAIAAETQKLEIIAREARDLAEKKLKEYTMLQEELMEEEMRVQSKRLRSQVEEHDRNNEENDLQPKEEQMKFEEVKTEHFEREEVEQNQPTQREGKKRVDATELKEGGTEKGKEEHRSTDDAKKTELEDQRLEMRGMESCLNPDENQEKTQCLKLDEERQKLEEPQNTEGVKKRKKVKEGKQQQGNEPKREEETRLGKLDETRRGATKQEEEEVCVKLEGKTQDEKDEELRRTKVKHIKNLEEDRLQLEDKSESKSEGPLKNIEGKREKQQEESKKQDEKSQANLEKNRNEQEELKEMDELKKNEEDQRKQLEEEKEKEEQELERKEVGWQMKLLEGYKKLDEELEVQEQELKLKIEKERKKQEELKRQEEERQKNAEEDKKREEELTKQDEKRKKKLEEENKKQEELKRKEKVQQSILEEEKKKQEELKRQEEERKKNAEEDKKRQEELIKQDEKRKKKLEEENKKPEELKRKEKVQHSILEEEKKKQEELKRQENEQKNKLEEENKKQEEFKRKEKEQQEKLEETRKNLEENLRIEKEGRKNKSEEDRKKQEECKRQEEECRNKLEEQRKTEEELQRPEEREGGNKEQNIQDRKIEKQIDKLQCTKSSESNVNMETEKSRNNEEKEPNTRIQKGKYGKESDGKTRKYEKTSILREDPSQKGSITSEDGTSSELQLGQIERIESVVQEESKRNSSSRSSSIKDRSSRATSKESDNQNGNKIARTNSLRRLSANGDDLVVEQKRYADLVSSGSSEDLEKHGIKRGSLRTSLKHKSEDEQESSELSLSLKTRDATSPSKHVKPKEIVKKRPKKSVESGSNKIDYVESKNMKYEKAESSLATNKAENEVRFKTKSPARPSPPRKENTRKEIKTESEANTSSLVSLTCAEPLVVPFSSTDKKSVVKPVGSFESLEGVDELSVDQFQLLRLQTVSEVEDIPFDSIAIDKKGNKIGTAKDETAKFMEKHRDPKKKPNFTMKLKDLEGCKGSRIKMTCCVIGSPEPTIEWMKNGFPIQSDGIKYESKLDPTGVVALEVKSLLREDSGEYTCVAKNIHGRTSSTADLRVRERQDADPSPPTFISGIQENYVGSENELVLSVRMSGFPLPRVVWYKDGNKLQSSRYKTSVTDDGHCRLVVISPCLSDVGQYTCFAENRVWKDEISCFVSLPEEIISRSLPITIPKLAHVDAPKIVRGLSDQEISLGGTVVWLVEVTGTPVPEAEWLHEGRSVFPSPKVRTSIPRPWEYQLIIYNITASDLGTYSCRLSNCWGTVRTVGELNLRLSKVPAVENEDGTGVAGAILEKPEALIIAIREEDLVVKCKVAGSPRPKVTWSKGSRDLISSPRTLMDNEGDLYTLIVKKILSSDSGTYSIEARNIYGGQKAYFTIRVKDGVSRSDWEFSETSGILKDVAEKRARRFRRDVPTTIPCPPVGSNIGQNFVSLTWQKPVDNGGAPIMAYKVEAWLLAEGAHWQELGISNITSFDIFNLKPDREYLFRITPRNKYGWGEGVTTKNPIRTGTKVTLPKFITPLNPQERVLVGSDVELNCEVTGEPLPLIMWKKDGMEINTERCLTLVKGSKHVLVIKNFSMEDAGKYLIEASNQAGLQTSFTSLLAVTDPKILEADEKIKRRLQLFPKNNQPMAPHFTMRARDRRIQVSYPVRITCQVVGFPKPELKWFKEDKMITKDDHYIFWQEEDFYTLEIQNTRFDDSGVYKIEAANTLGAIRSQCHLTVDGGVKAYISPLFMHELEDKVVSDRSTLHLVAKVDAYPVVGVTWHRDGLRLRPSRKHAMKLDRDGTVTLEVSHASRRDAGTYTCAVTNEMGQAESSCKVTIRGTTHETGSEYSAALKVEALIPKFLKKPRSTEVFEGETLIIFCEVAGDPKPEVIWLRDFLKPGYYRDSDTFVFEGEGPEYRLEIPCVKLDHTGTYSIIARNMHGEAKAVLSVQVKTKNFDDMILRQTKLGTLQTIPELKQPLRDLRCCDGDSVTLECRIKAEPPPYIRWTKSGKNLPKSPDFEEIYDGTIARLNIHQVYPEDEGEYTCIGYNDLGKISTSACLVVDIAHDKENDVTGALDTRPQDDHGCSNFTTPRTTPLRCMRSASPAILSSPLPRRRNYTEELQPLPRLRMRSSAPKFYAVPHNKVAEVGDIVRFQCAVAGHPLPKITWDKENSTICASDRFSFEERNDVRILEIRNVQLEDAGLYRVTVENDLGRLQASARLDVISKSNRGTRTVSTGSSSRLGLTSPYFSRRLVSSSSRLGGSASFRAEIRGGSLPRPSWYHNFQKLENQNRISISNKGGISELVINDIGEDDFGEITCVVEFDGECDACSAFLLEDVYKQPPTFASKIEQTLNGNALVLSVDVQGSELIRTIWVCDEEEIPESNCIGSSGLRSITTRNFNVGSIYVCEAYNAYGEAETWTIAQHDNSKSESKPCTAYPPSILHPLKETIMEENCRIQLEVCVQGCPAPNVEFRLNERAVDQKHVSKEGSWYTLIAESLLLGEKPLVQCIASNLHGRVSNDCTLVSPSDFKEKRETSPDHVDSAYKSFDSDSFVFPEMEGVAELVGVPAEILIDPENVTVLRGEAFSLNIEYIGIPEPTVAWLKGGKVLEDDDRIQIETDNGVSQLRILAADENDCGKYIVVAANGFGSDCRFSSVNVEGPPEPPGGAPNVNEVGNGSATLSWYGSIYDGGSAVTDYIVETREEYENCWSTVARCNSTSYKVTDLRPRNFYQFRVKAVNKHGEGDPSLETDLVCLEQGPPQRKISTISVISEEEYDGDCPFSYRFVTCEPGMFFAERYSIHDELGKGRFGVVHRAYNLDLGQPRAAKIVRCIKHSDKDKVKEEINIMNRLQHKKLLQLESAFEFQKEIILVTELVSGGELFERVVADDFTLTEKDAILFMRQICEGVQYMHDLDIVHLDLKPENILCVSPTSHSIKIIDFGLARKLLPDTPVRVLFGTPEFIPPEIVSYEPISLASDMWAVGVICYVLLSGLSPFMGDNDTETFANITRADFDFSDEAFRSISTEAKEFIAGLLIKKPEYRFSASECLKHKWLAQAERKMKTIRISTEKLKKFIIRRKWQKTGNAIRALGRITGNLSSSRRNSSVLPSRRSSHLVTLREEIDINSIANLAAIQCRTRSPSLPPRISFRKASERSDSGISEWFNACNPGRIEEEAINGNSNLGKQVRKTARLNSCDSAIGEED
ncbi:hypothetical protein QYM36_014620 [Artemia franciscana]|uniref:Muscle M-line assembly protein unc-89 n=2 Tax=Artemia franciscana TaxID=6661 RepID=A0AA88L5U4_ARTSF|nr:hypothetical protein QYM36_014620 [Artemia franciscana]